MMQSSPEPSYLWRIREMIVFKLSTFKDADKLGRWIVLDSGDLDQDGDEDIVLGSLAFEVPGDVARVEYWAENGIPFVVLENGLK